MTIMTRSQYKIYTKRFYNDSMRDMEHLQEIDEWKTNMGVLKWWLTEHRFFKLNEVYEHYYWNILGPIFK